MNDFKTLREFFDEMNSSNSVNHKVETLEKYKDSAFIKKVLFYTYHPLMQFYTTSESVKKYDGPESHHMYSSLFGLLDSLSKREIRGHEAIAAVQRFIAHHEDYSDLIYQIIDRNLETRATTSLINRVIPGLIPTFDVALAFDAAKMKKLDLTDGTWFVSRKLDGVRCIIMIDQDGNAKFFSRNGKPFETLGVLQDEIRRLGIINCVLDGEVCLGTADDGDDFQGVIKQIQRKDHTIPNPKFYAFDFLSQEEFDRGSGEDRFSQRYDALKLLFKRSKFIEVLEQNLIDSEFSLLEIKEIAHNKSWEGLIARRDVPYESGRTRNMLKLKEFYDAEYVVKDLIMGPQRVIVDGVEMEEEMLSALVIEHKGCRVRVGSGFKISERREYYEKPELLLGNTVTIQYFEETQDQNGDYSLRFPVFKWNHGKTRSI